MTINITRGEGDRLTLRYIPLLAWSFIGLASYGTGTIVATVAGGQQPMNGGTLLGLAALVTMILFVAVTGGQLVICGFSRGDNEVRIARYGLHGRSVTSRPLSEVVGMDVRVLRRAQYRIELRMSSGERLPLTPYYVVAFGTGGIERVGELLGVDPVTVQQRVGLRQ